MVFQTLNFAGLLTKKFIKLIQEAKDGTLDLNRTADVLQVIAYCQTDAHKLYRRCSGGWKTNWNRTENKKKREQMTTYKI